jgi:hypothetical protein
MNYPTNDRTTLVMDTGPVVKRLREIQAEIEAMDEMFDLSKATEEAARDAEEYRLAGVAFGRTKAELEEEAVYRAHQIRHRFDRLEQEGKALRHELNRLIDVLIASR